MPKFVVRGWMVGEKYYSGEEPPPEFMHHMLKVYAEIIDKKIQTGKYNKFKEPKVKESFTVNNC